MLDPAHGGLIHHYSVPKFVISEVGRFGFTIKEVQGDDYPVLAEFNSTRWYYYVFSKSDVATSPTNRCPPSAGQLQHQTKS